MWRCWDFSIQRLKMSTRRKSLRFVVEVTIFVLCLHGTLAFDLASMLSQKSISGKLPLPDLKSLVSPETLQKVLQAKALGIPVVSAEVSLPDSKALSELLAKLKPKESRFDPALIEKFHSSLESINPNRQGAHVFQKFANSMEDRTVSSLTTTSTSPVSSVIPKRKRGKSKKNKFSSKFRMNDTVIAVENPNLANYNITVSGNGRSPFSYITDPNIRNHRLYDWEFETYKNFTHIDQMEDLFADESSPSTEHIHAHITTTGPTKISRIPNSGWVPSVRDKIPPRPLRPPHNPKEPPPASYETFGDQTTSHSNLYEHVVMPPGVFVRFTPEKDSNEPNKFRAPLRASSTENQIYRHRNSNGESDKFDENSSRPSAENFRPSQPELSAPVFVDPDQDFFTSTIKHPGGSDSSTEGNFNMPMFPAHKRNRPQEGEKTRDRNRDRDRDRDRDRNNRYKNEHPKRNKFYSDEEYEEQHGIPSKHKSDRILSHSDKVINNRQSPKKHNYDTNYMSEYLGHTPSAAASDPAAYYEHPDSAGDEGSPGANNNGQQSDTGLVDFFGQPIAPPKPRPLLADQIYAGGQHNQYYHPYGQFSNQIHYIEDEHEGSSWYNTFFILGGLVALSALIAFFLPSLLHVSSAGKDVDKLGDVNSDVDLWSEIKGVYNDLVHIVRGDYSYFNNKRYGNNGINLTYRNEDTDDSETATLQGDTVEISRRASRRHDKSRNNNSNNSGIAYHLSNSGVNSTSSILNGSANSFLGEWAKVQLINN